eukprot:gene8664-10170_t
MTSNEMLYFYNSLNVEVSSCSNSTTGADGTYSLDTCIYDKIPECIAIVYPTHDNGMPSLDFRTPWRPSLNDPKHSIGHVDWLISAAATMFFITALCIMAILIMSYIRRSRAQLLLAINVLLIPSDSQRKNKWVLIASLIFMAVAYTAAKIGYVNELYQVLSVITCNDQQYYLHFEGSDSTRLISVENLVNYIIFAFIFKDPIMEIYHGLTHWYGDLGLVRLLELKDRTLLPQFEHVEVLTTDHVNQVMKDYVAKHYPNIGAIERFRRSHIFLDFTSSKKDIIPAILEYKKQSPDHFISLFNSHKRLVDDQLVEDLNDDDDQIAVHTETQGTCNGGTPTLATIRVDNYYAFDSVDILSLGMSIPATIIDDSMSFTIRKSGTYTIRAYDSLQCTVRIDVEMTVFSIQVPTQPACPFTQVPISMDPSNVYPKYSIDNGPVTAVAVPALVQGDGMHTLFASSPTATGCALQFSLNVANKNAKPTITTTRSQCGANTGTLTLANPSSYTSINLLLINGATSIDSTTGVFENLPVSGYILTLQSTACAKEVLQGSIEADASISVTFVNSTCQSLVKLTASLIGSVVGDPSPAFKINGQPMYSLYQVLSGSSFTVTYTHPTNPFCSLSTFATAPISQMSLAYSFSNIASCASPTTIVTLFHSYPQQVDVNSNETIPVVDNKFKANYGQTYEVSYSDCESNSIIIDIPRVQPVYTVQQSRNDCLAEVTVTVVNYLAFKQPMKIYFPGSNPLIEVVSSNGVFTGMTRGSWKIVYTEADCGSAAEEEIQIDISPNSVSDLDPSKFVIVTDLTTVPSCGAFVETNVRVTYDGIIGYSKVLETTQISNILEFRTRYCRQQVTYNLPINASNPNNFAVVSIVSQPSCKYANGQVSITPPGTSQIDEVIINGKIGVKSGSNYLIVNGLNTIQVFYTNCPFPYTTTVTSQTTSPYVFQYTTIDQSTADCNVKSGSIKWPTGITKIVMNGLVQGTAQTPSLPSGNYQVDFEDLTGGCSGSLIINIATATNVLAGQKLIREPTCDATDDVGDASFGFYTNEASIPVTKVIVEDPKVIVVGNTVVSKVPSGILAFPVWVSSNNCQWKVNLNTKSNTPTMFKISVLKVPCPGASDGVLLIEQQSESRTTITRVFADSDSPDLNFASVGYGSSAKTTVYGWSHNNLNAIDSIIIEWNGVCEKTFQFSVPNAQFVREPSYTIQYPLCGSMTLAVKFDSITLNDYDIIVTQPAGGGNLIPDINGVVYIAQKQLQASTVHYTYKQTMCTKNAIIDNTGPFLTIVGKPSYTTVNESCQGSADGKIVMSSATHKFLLMSEPFVAKGNASAPIASSNGLTFTGLTSSTPYYLISQSVSNPQCLSIQPLSIGHDEPTFDTDSTATCDSNLLGTVHARLDIDWPTNVQYSLDDGTFIANNSIFTNVSEGSHTVAVKILDKSCPRLLPAAPVQVASSPIILDLDNSVCESISFTFSRGSSPTNFTIKVEQYSAINYETLESGSKKFTGLKEGAINVQVSDTTGCSVTKTSIISKCTTPLSTTTTTTATASTDQGTTTLSNSRSIYSQSKIILTILVSIIVTII